jgi:WD40 repeat protein
MPVGGPNWGWVVASKTSQVLYLAKDKKVHRATVKNGRLENDEILPIAIKEQGQLKACTPDGSKLAFWAENEMQVWDLYEKQPKIVHRIPSQLGVSPEHTAVISPDGKWLAVKSHATALFRLDAPEPQRVAWLDQTDQGGGQSGAVAFSSDGRKAIVANHNGLVRFWDLSGAEPKELSPLDPDATFPTLPYLGTTAFDPSSAVLLLPRFDIPPATHVRRWQQWALGAKKPQAGPLLDTNAFGQMSAAGQDRWVQTTPFEGAVSRQYRLAENKFQQLGETFGPADVFGSTSPDGKTLIFYSLGAPSHLEGWDLSAQIPKQKWAITPKDHTPMGGYGAWQLWISGDNRWLATQGNRDKDGDPWKLVLWRNTMPKPEVHSVMPIPWHVALYRAAFSPDGRYLAHTPNQSHEVVLLDLTGKTPREIGKFQDETKINGDHANLAFHPDSKKLAVGSSGGVCILDVPAMKPLWHWPSPGNIPWLAWANDGRHLVTHNANMTLYVLRLNQFAAIEKDGNKIAISPKEATPEPAKPSVPGQPILVGPSPFDKLDPAGVPKAERFEWQPKELVAVVGSHARRHWGWVNAVAISPDGKLAASHAASGKDSLIIWDLAKQEVKWTLEDGSGPHYGSLQFSQDNKQLFCLRYGVLRIVSLSGEKPIVAEHNLSEKEDGRNDAWHYCALCDNDRTLVVSGWDDKIALFDLSPARPKLVSTRSRGKLYHPICVARESSQVLYADTTGTSGKLRRATIKDGRFDMDEELPIKLGDKEYPRAVTPDGKRLALSGGDHLQLWGLSQNPPKQVQTIMAGDVVVDSRYAFSPDGRWLTATNNETALFRVDGPEAKFVAWLDQTGSAGAGHCDVAFNADNNKLVLGNSEGFVRIWDLSAKAPQELSPWDANTAFRGWFAPALDPMRGHLMLRRYDGWNRHQLFDLGQARPQPMPDATTYLDPDQLDPDRLGPVKQLSLGRWVCVGAAHKQNARVFAIRDGAW